MVEIKSSLLDVFSLRWLLDLQVRVLRHESRVQESHDSWRYQC